jgi:protein tyrosine/serine phosphatase
MTSSGIPLKTVRAKSMALTHCGHGSDKNCIYAAKELKQNLKHCKQLRKLYLQTEKVIKKRMLQAINHIKR